MAVLYTTVEKEASAEQTIERSRFISYIKRVSTKEEADEFFQYVNDMHKDCRHCVPAFVIGDKMQLQWASDNGEPQGTAGAPIVQMLVKEGVTNVAVGVIRYFGGIKLGTGGLVRAYTSSAKLALDAAGLHQVKELCLLTVDIPYTMLGKLQNNEKSMDFEIADIQYLAEVTVKLSFEPEAKEQILAMLSDLLSGKIPETMTIEETVL